MAGVFPFFRATVAKTCPVALREDLAIHFPELLSDEFKDLMGLGALSLCLLRHVVATHGCMLTFIVVYSLWGSAWMGCCLQYSRC